MTQASIEKAKPIRLFIFDIDGILTDGRIYYGNQGNELKAFHVQDGLGIKFLHKANILVAVISAKNSDAVVRRMQELNIIHTYLGYAEKLPVYEELKQKLNLEDQQIAYMADDLPDLPVLRRVGLSITVPQAPEIIKQHVTLITRKPAGMGAVREACEFVLEAQEQLEPVIQSYFST